ncbi:AraC family transcriptional regulator [Microbulbifer agarilyticus]|uniref:AraC family transcriptional regulator n=1 Tax=Microbulbifer agarilyticus TaxID=260552 RepID=UPI0009842D54|nr:AraC family transcriptional regulator [Microbulbifer agarilyticus]
MTEASDSIQQAANLWRIVSGVAVDDSAVSSAMIYLSYQSSGIAEDLLPQWSGERLRELFLKQPNAEEFIERWRGKFVPEVTLQKSELVTFINEFLAAHQHIDDYFESLTIFGHSRRTRGGLGDFLVRRPPGSSNNWGLLFTTEGRGRFNCVRQQFVARPGDMVLLAPGALYEFHRHLDEEHWNTYWLYCKPAEKVMNLMNWQELGPYIYHQAVPAVEMPRIQGIFQQLFELESPAEPLAQAVVENLAEQLFLRSFQYAQRAGGTIVDSRVKSALSYISDHLYEDFSIQDVADASSLSRARLSKLFKAYTGRSILQWRDERRMSDACQALAKNAGNVQAVAEAVGYDDPLYFSRKFHQIVGVSPRQYIQDRRGQLTGT